VSSKIHDKDIMHIEVMRNTRSVCDWMIKRSDF